MPELKEPVAELGFLVKIVFIKLFITNDIGNVRVLKFGVLHCLGCIVYITLVFELKVLIVFAGSGAGVFIKSGEILHLVEEFPRDILIFLVQCGFFILG